LNARNLLVLVSLSAALNASAQTTLQENQRKYCGSGFTEKLVPEAPFGCQMSEACKAHDACYGKCDEGGEMYGKPYCTESEFSVLRVKAKLACEGNFYRNIDKSNDGRWVCKGLGALYVAAVAVVGQGPFNGRQIQLATMEDLILTSNSIDEIKMKTTTITALSQRGLIDLHQVKRVQDRIEFSPFLKDGLAVTPQFDFKKGIDLKDLKKLQTEKLGK
jgi:hypothetical protein